MVGIRILVGCGDGQQFDRAIEQLREYGGGFSVDRAADIDACRDRLDGADCVLVDAPGEENRGTLEAICAEFDPFPVFVAGDADRVARA